MGMNWLRGKGLKVQKKAKKALNLRFNYKKWTLNKLNFCDFSFHQQRGDIHLYYNFNKTFS